MQDRDKQVVNFINTFELCKSEHIKEIFFPDVHKNICMRRLKKLADNEHIKRVKMEGNIFVYYTDKKPSKRFLTHDMYITDFIVKMIKEDCEILEFVRGFKIGDIKSDAYIKYKDVEGKTRHCILEIQLNNIQECIEKYRNFKEIIISNKQWNTIPQIVCITDVKQRVELPELKIYYDTTEMNNIPEILNS
jgi:hypothetical protein